MVNERKLINILKNLKMLNNYKSYIMKPKNGKD